MPMRGAAEEVEGRSGLWGFQVQHKTSMGTLPPEKGTLIPEIYSSLGLNIQGKQASETPRVLSVFSSLLQRTSRRNETLLEAIRKKQAVSVFHGLRVPNITIKRYIERIYRYAKCSPSCFVLAHIYIDRFVQQPNVHVTSLNVHRLLITSVMVAAKFTDEVFYNNAYYAKVGGISTAELNKMEISFLFSLDFRLQVSTQTFGRYCLQLEKEVVAGRSQVERPIQTCGLNGWKSNEEPKSRPPMQKYGCGAV